MHNFIGDNIHALRINKGLTQEQFAQIAGASQSAVSAWECGTSTPRHSNVQRILDAIPGLVSDDILSNETGYAKKVLRNTPAMRAKKAAKDPWHQNAAANTSAPSDSSENHIASVPFFGSIAAGKPLEMLATTETYEIPRDIHRKHPQAFLLKVNGESMNKVIPNGSYALVDPALKEVIDGKVFAVSVDNASATIKRIRLLNNGVELQPDSNDPTIKTMIFDYADSNSHTLTILGQVVWYTIPYGFEL